MAWRGEFAVQYFFRRWISHIVSSSFEIPKRIHISMDAFTVENGTMTPTMKLRRKDAYNKYKTELDALYALGDPAGVSSYKLWW